MNAWSFLPPGREKFEEQGIGTIAWTGILSQLESVEELCRCQDIQNVDRPLVVNESKTSLAMIEFRIHISTYLPSYLVTM